MYKLLLATLTCLLISFSGTATASKVNPNRKKIIAKNNTRRSSVKKVTSTEEIKKRKVKRKNSSLALRSRKKGTRKKSSSKKSISKIILDDFTRNKGSFSFPLDQGTIKTAFGPYKVGTGNIIGFNPGLTIETISGSGVQSVFDGIVTDLFEMEGRWGITIQHGNYFTVYGNLSSVNVSQYETIPSGTIIGNAANNKDGLAELEFLLLRNNKNIDPGPWIKRN